MPKLKYCRALSPVPAQPVPDSESSSNVHTNDVAVALTNRRMEATRVLHDHPNEIFSANIASNDFPMG